MKCYIIMSVLLLELLLLGSTYSADALAETLAETLNETLAETLDETLDETKRKGPTRCKKPKGKVGETIRSGCSVATCQKSGIKAVWIECPRPATEKSTETRFDAVEKKLDVIEQTVETGFEEVEKKLNVSEKAMENGFDAVEKKLDVIEQTVETGFEEVEKKLNVSEKAMENRFDAVEKKLDVIEQTVETGFEEVEKKLDVSEKSMETRFDAVEKKLDVSEQSTETRFDAVEKKLDISEKKVDAIEQLLHHHFAICPSTWKEFQSNCYKIFGQKLSWLDAESACQMEGAHLLSLHSQAENQFVYTYVYNHASWIGGNDANTEWSDGTPWNYQNWASGEPSHSDSGIGTREECVGYISHAARGTWNDYLCNTKLYYICKKLSKNI